MSTYAQCPGFNPVNLGPDTTLCPGQTLSLNAAATGPYSSYQWNNNSTSPLKIINAAGTYWVKVTTLGPNVITNGDFESGNTGFSTAYTVGTGGTWGLVSNPSTYAIVNSPNAAHNNFASCTDHTANPGTLMMVVNGSSTPNTNVWCQTVAVTPGTDYQFGAWAANALNDPNVAQLQFSINSVNIGPIFSTATTACTWQQFFQTWNAGLNSSANICINNQNTAGGGNDFLLDDITFRPVCTDYDTITVTYSTNPVVNLGTDQTICSIDSITLDAQNPGMNYNWNTGATTQTITVNTAGTYSVTVTNAAGCSGSDQFILSTETIKNAGNDSLAFYCETNGLVNLNSLLNPSANANETWQDLTGNTNGQLSANGNFLTNGLSGTVLAHYIVSGTFCPNDTAQFALTINQQPVAAPNATDHLCNTANQSVVLSNYVSGSLATLPAIWEEISSTPSNQFDPTSATLNQSGLANGNYIFAQILPADTMCLADTAFVSIQITENPIVDFSSDKIKGCFPLDIAFINESIANPNSVYFWELGDGTTSNSSTSVNHTYTGIDCFDVRLTITADGLCTTSALVSDMICVDPLPVANFVFSPQQTYSIDPTITIENTSTNSFINSWDFGDGTTSFEVNPVHQFPLGAAENYVVQLIVTSDQGCLDTTSQIVTVKDQLLYFVPNTFTPDGDEFNNTFLPIMTAGIDISSYEFYVFNRWGELMFQSNDVNSGWDGTYNGRLLPSGTYTWKIRFKFDTNDGKQEFAGHVNLLR